MNYLELLADPVLVFFGFVSSFCILYILCLVGYLVDNIRKPFTKDQWIKISVKKEGSE